MECGTYSPVSALVDLLERNGRTLGVAQRVVVRVLVEVAGSVDSMNVSRDLCSPHNVSYVAGLSEPCETYSTRVDDGVNSLVGNGGEPTHDEVATRINETDSCRKQGRGGVKFEHHGCCCLSVKTESAGRKTDSRNECGLLDEQADGETPKRV